jgi:two-component system, OmpR family, osmolarity sensor histidine kinase EnvZ
LKPQWRHISKDSLIFRLVLLVLGVAVLSLLLQVLVTLNFVRVISGDFVAVMASTVKHERTLLLAAAPDSRPQLAAELSNVSHRVKRLVNFEDGPEIATQRTPASKLNEDLQAAVGPEVRVSMRVAPNAPIGVAISFRFDVKGEIWEIAHEPSSPALVALGGVLGWLMLVAVAVIGAAAVGVSMVNKPLRNLSSQLAQRTRVIDPLNAPPRAGSEIRELVSSFNRLVESNVEAERSKQHMLAGISHDLRTPLTRLRFRVEMSCDAKALVDIGRDLDALERIVKQFIGYAQSESHVGFGEPWPLDEVVSRIVSSYATQNLPVTIKASEVTVTMPDLAIQRALTNLIDNALEYGRGGVEVSLHPFQNKTQTEIHLTVWDDGDGMTDAEFARAQQPFSRLAQEHRSAGHCGLGLAIVAQIAAQTQGSLRTVRGLNDRFGISIMWSLST